MAHSFLPENKRDYRKTKTVTWNGKDINTTEGIEQFDSDMLLLQDYLFQMAFGKNLATSAAHSHSALASRFSSPSPRRRIVSEGTAVEEGGWER